MDALQPPPNPPIPPEPTHPLECLRLIELPRCVVCGNPTRFYCGGCLASPAFCSPEHFVAYWPTHSVRCTRDLTLHSAGRLEDGVVPAHPYPGSIVLATRSAVLPPVLLGNIHLPVPVNYDRPYPYVVNGMYAKHDGLACSFMPINLSPNPVQGECPTRIQDCFEPAAQVRSFVIRRDVYVAFLDNPFHIFYCAESYAHRRNINHALARLTQCKDPSYLHPWFGSIVILKFASRACQNYEDMTVSDVITVRDYFAYYG